MCLTVNLHVKIFVISLLRKLAKGHKKGKNPA